MRLQEAGFEVDLGGKEAVTRSGLNLSLGDKQFKLRHLQPSKEVAIRLSSDHSSIGYNFKSKDVDFEYRTQVRPGKLYIRQRIPHAQWELFPTPEFKLCVNPQKWGKLEHRVALSYDLLASRRRVEQSFDFNKRLKFKVNADSTTGGFYALIANLNRSWAKSVSIDYSKKIGPVLMYHAEPSKQFLFDTALSFQRHELWASVQVGPTKDSKIKLTAEATANTSSLTRPALRLGARYTV